MKQKINSRAERRPWRNTWQPPDDISESSGRVPTRHNHINNVSNTQQRQQSQSMLAVFRELTNTLRTKSVVCNCWACACLCVRAHLQRLSHNRKVRKTLKTIVLRRMSRRPRTVTDTRFNVGSVQQQHYNSQTHKNTHKHTNDWSCHTGTSTHLASACHHMGRIHHPLNLHYRWSWKPPGWTASRHWSSSASYRWIVCRYHVVCSCWNQSPNKLLCRLFAAGSKRDCIPHLDRDTKESHG